MPIYEYECTKNKHRFEVMQKFSDPPVSTCTICGEPVQRLVSAPAIQFKGSGWYITDYARKSDGKGNAHSAKTPSSKDTDKSSESTPLADKKEASSSSSDSKEK
jgi:putative FmdB family regulatory protein